MSICKVSPETLAENILRALTVQAFENDPSAEAVLMRQRDALASVLQRYVEPKPVPRVARALFGVTPPETITFSGLDPSANFDEVKAISDDYPATEWAVLVAPVDQREPQPRYPSLSWIDATAAWCANNRVRLAAHLCGVYARDALDDPVAIESLLPLHMGAIRRVQINHWRAGADVKRLAAWSIQNRVSVIVQWPGDEFPDDRGVSWLADQSRGEGRRRINWPEPVGERLFGFAGGIGPENVVDVVRTIGQTPGRYWIDMESSLFEGPTFLASRARSVCERVFGPSPLEVERQRDSLLKIAEEIEGVLSNAQDLGMHNAVGDSVVHDRLRRIESYVAQALGVVTLRDALAKDGVTVEHTIGRDKHFIPAGSSADDLADLIEEAR